MSDRSNEDPRETIKRNFEQLGGDIGDAGREIAESVRKILSAGELRDLGDNIRRSVREATEEIHRSQRVMGNTAPGEALQRRYIRPETGQGLIFKKNTSPLAKRINTKKFGHGKCVAMAAVSGAGTLFFASVSGILQALASSSLASGWNFLGIGMSAIYNSLEVGSAMFGLLTLLTGLTGIKWLTRLRLASVLGHFQSVIGDKTYCDLKFLAKQTGRSVKKVRKDIRKLLRKQGLKDCYLDNEEQTLIIGWDTYQLYLDSGAQRSGTWEPKAEEAPPKAPPVQESAPAETPGDNGVEDLEINSSQFIAHIRAINDALPEREISEKLDRLEHICAKIFAYVEQHPDKLPQIRRFMDYYLPTTLKLMEAYRELTGHGSYGEVEETKAEIHSAMEKINHAFENLFGNLLRNDLLHLSADISALEAMLAQEGLSEDEDSKLC